MLSNKEAVVQAVEICSEIGVAGLSQRLHLDKGTVRKVALEAVKEGRIGARNDGQGDVFFGIGGQAAEPVEQRVLYRADSANSPQVIDGEFEVLSQSHELQTPSTSRALVPVATATFDSRLDPTLKRNALARRSPHGRGQALPGQAVALLNQAFIDDPNGTDALTALQQAMTNRLRDASEHERWEREETEQRRKEDEQRKEAEAKKKQTKEIDDAIHYLLHMEEEEAPPRCSSSHKLGTLDYEEEPEPTSPVRDRFRERQGTERAAPARVDHVAELLAKAKKAAPKDEPPPVEVSRRWQWPIAIAALGVFAVIVVMSPLQQ
jgi:hypothetical protein